MKLIILIIGVILGLSKIAGTIFLLVGVINFMISGVANASFLWVGFGMYAAGMLVDILGSDNGWKIWNYIKFCYSLAHY